MMTSILLLLLIFLGLLNGHVSCTSESIIIQNLERNNRRTGKMQGEENGEKAFLSLEGPRSFVITRMRPVRSGFGEVWREVSRERIDRIRNSNPTQDARRGDRINPWNSRMTGEWNIPDFNRRKTNDKNKSQKLVNIVSGSSRNNSQNVRKTITIPASIKNKDETLESVNPVINKSPKRVSPDSNFFSGIVNNFAFKLMETLNLESNFVISPLSIFIALCMCYLGSDGHSKIQMEQAMGMNDNAVHGEHLHKGIKDLLNSMMEKNSGFELFVANGIFLANNFTADAQFEENIKKYYDGELKTLDFAKHPVLSLGYINEWISENTKNMITTILNSPPSFLTRLIFLNAVYFKGKWKTPFPPLSTRPAQFHLVNGNNIEIQLMRLYYETFPVFGSDEHKHTFIKLPYEGDDVSMIIALPYEVRQKPMPSITDEILCTIRDGMVDLAFDFVGIPKFRMEHGESLISPLKKLGMTDIFGEKANFSKLRSEKVQVDEIMHKAAIEVNEEGTMASAVTSIKIGATSYREEARFVADHPFAFYIVHEPTGLVLFYGKVFDIESKPSKSI